MKKSAGDTRPRAAYLWACGLLLLATGSYTALALAGVQLPRVVGLLYSVAMIALSINIFVQLRRWRRARQ